MNRVEQRARSLRKLKSKIEEVKKRPMKNEYNCPVCGTELENITTPCCDGRDDWEAKNWQTEDDPRTMGADHGE